MDIYDIFKVLTWSLLNVECRSLKYFTLSFVDSGIRTRATLVTGSDADH